MTFFQQCINGLSLGSMYALIAIGYTMVYGCLRLINFAHADIMMVGAFLVFLPLAPLICLFMLLRFYPLSCVES